MQSLGCDGIMMMHRPSTESLCAAREKCVASNTTTLSSNIALSMMKPILVRVTDTR
jgi:hypothetical protein